MKSRLTLLCVSLLVACGQADQPMAEAPAAPIAGSGESSVANRAPSEIGQAIASSAAQFAIPSSVLAAVAYAETRFYFVPGQGGDATGDEAIYGVMALRGERLAQGARLAGVSVEQAQQEVLANVRAGAALLRSYADEAGIDRNELAAWAGPIARFSGLPSSEAQAYFIHNVVYKTLREGLPVEIARLHGLSSAPQTDLVPRFAPIGEPRLPFAGVRYSGSVWNPAPSSNYTSGRSATIDLLVIHTCSGGYSGCVDWLTTPYPTNPYKTSAHYVVREDGGEISALVDESNTAHHVGASWEGRPTNPRSVGIEHGGFSYQGTNKWTEGQVSASSKLACDIVKRNRIVRDRNHIIGHYQPDPVNRASDPGTSFPWADYMNRISRCIGGSTAIIVDSNQANNDASGQIDTPSSSWTSSTNVSGYYGSGYYVAPTAAVSDALYFKFYLPTSGSHEVFAWWTAASDRSSATPFVMFDASGNRLGSVTRNQQDDGSQWISLGTYNFTAGWNQVAVSRWATAGSYVVADAIKVE
jgi:hypothetical protein